MRSRLLIGLVLAGILIAAAAGLFTLSPVMVVEVRAPLSIKPAQSTSAALVVSPPPLDSDFVALVRGIRSRSRAGSSVDALVVLTMFDAAYLSQLLRSVDVPVQCLIIVWNSNDTEVGELLRPLQRASVPGVFVFHRPANVGFAGGVNLALSSASRMCPRTVRWSIVTNADVAFDPGALGAVSKAVRNANVSAGASGLFYFSKIDHSVFAVTVEAFTSVAGFDENFYPAYNEDIDFRWRVHLAQFKSVVVAGATYRHFHSVNLKRKGSIHYRTMLRRAGRNNEYLVQKWGPIPSLLRLNDDVPPSGWRQPFGVSLLTPSTWRLDVARLQCIRDGHGVRHRASDVCWYNGSGLADEAVLPPYLLMPLPLGVHPRSPQG